ncbi:MAG TPA: LysR substrate-binding domain-containing protein [Herbaspirillum sp.]|jgi:LysR family glycine cleavage system transcriptional activator
MRALPPLNYLRSFQLAGKHLNLGRAAAEMNLTPSALSHQLKRLEIQLGIKLFTRTGRGLAFTKAGKDLHGDVDAGLMQVSKAIDRVSMREETNNTLVVNTLPTFATHWLLPRFASFEKHYARIEIRVSTKPINFESDEIDCAIYYGREGGPGMISEFLRDESLIVVAAPETINAAKPLEIPTDLLHHQLLHARSRLDTQNRLEGWDAWFYAAGMPELQGQKGLVLETRNLLIQAAKSGLGIAVVDPLMVQDELKSGQLVQPLKLVAKSSCAYYLVYPASVAPSEKVVAFRNWLLGELAREEQQ